MRNLLRRFTLSVTMLSIGLCGASAAQTRAGGPAAPANTPSPPGPAKPVAATAAAPAAGTAADATRDELKKDLATAHAKMAEDKKALAEAKKGKDKAAIQTAQNRVKEDGKAIQDIQNKLHALKTAKPATKDTAK